MENWLRRIVYIEVENHLEHCLFLNIEMAIDLEVGSWELIVVIFLVQLYAI